ncbi:pollen-specific leucine-rich repeat extensin-like protein 1 [Anopheles arabiensis]|uniref:pollen-specific leucine-rich repeat extensin-like protein 1 n=1 Tax=Anopheles arabiensis TaxID=7173 RepID=UPI001AACD251|nr:pollen-specific leucine-rich repeat extensin-like protein 1 [Anopheles arabiensis]
MRLQGTWLTLAFGLVVLVASGDAQTRRLRVRPRVLAAPSSAEYVDSAEDAQQDNRQYYAAPQRAQERLGDVVLVASSDEDYGGGQYGAPVAAARPRADQQQYQRPAAKSTTAAPVAARQKAPASESRAPPVQTIRNYSKVNDDGSFTFGYEAADGSFKEETRGTDCVVRGKYGYIDPDGNKREFTYVSGNPCDPNNPDGSEEEESDRAEGGQEDSNENVPQNYPVRRPVPVARPTPAAPVRHHSTPAPAPRPTTTVFQNDYQDRQRQEQQSADAEEEVQIGQRGSPPRPAARPFAGAVTTTQRPRVQIVSTTPSPTPTIFHSPAAPAAPQTVLPVNITPKPVYRVSPLPTQPTLAPTTYRPTSSPSTRGPTGSIDFEAEFKRFQADNKLPSPPTPSTAPSGGSAPKPTGSPFGRPGPQLAAGNPIYQSQLIFDPASGQYDTALYQQLPQSDGDFQLNHRIQPYVAGPQQHQHQHHQPQPQPQQQHPGAGQLVTLEQLQQQSPLYRAQPSPRPATVQIPQQLYQKQQNELQFINSQQLFAQQLELQQSQLRADRLEAAKKVTVGGPPMHRFQPQPQPQQQYYFIQPQGPPQGAPGQIDAFLRGHNIEY